MIIKNIFNEIPARLSDELFETLLQNDSLKLERIVSKGHATSDGNWYNQEEDEWVLLMKGRATVELKGETDLVNLTAGDYILLPAHLEHRVVFTDPEEDAVWLALHFKSTV